MLRKVGKQFRSPIGLGLLFCLGILAVVLVVEGWTGLPAFAPYALLILCPLMHLFMHRGMRDPSAHSQHSGTNED